MSEKFKKRYILLALLIVFGALAITAYTTRIQDRGTYVHGKYGRYCYQVGYAHKNIKEFVYFDSYEACLADLTAK